MICDEIDKMLLMPMAMLRVENVRRSKIMMVTTTNSDKGEKEIKEMYFLCLLFCPKVRSADRRTQMEITMSKMMSMSAPSTRK